VPIATDIAFALGILSLLGRRVPVSLKIFLTAVAIADDMGAVLIIALFYTSQLSLAHLLGGLALLALMALANTLGIRRTLPYLLLGCGAWLLFYSSGVHATVSGVIAAMTIPARPKRGAEDFVAKSRSIIKEFERVREEGGLCMLESKRQPQLLLTLREACRDAETPLQRLDAMLHPWVAFVIMPVFALVNAGVLLPLDMALVIAHPVNLGIMLGLILGKPLGVTLSALALTASGLAPKLSGVNWRHLLGAGCLAGIGFTMSIFITELAFSESAIKDSAKLGILSGSLVSSRLGWGVLRGLTDAPKES